MEDQEERVVKQAHNIEDREESEQPQTAAHVQAQGLQQPAIPYYQSAARKRGKAQHQQQKRGDKNRPEKEPQQPKREVKG